MNSESFLDQLAKTKQYQSDLRDLEDLKLNEEKTYVLKLEEMNKNNEDTSDFIESYKDKTYVPIDCQIPIGEMRNYLLVFDNVGEDLPIDSSVLKEIVSHCMLIKKTWEEQNLRKLNEDVSKYISSQEKIEARVEGDFEKELENFNASQKKTEENQIKDDLNIQNGTAHLNAKNLLIEAHNFWTHKLLEQTEELRLLENYNFVRFPEIFQLYFYSRGLKKTDVNFPETNIIDWKKCGQYFSLFHETSLENYKFDESRPGEFKNYQLTNVIYDKLVAIPWSDVSNYYFPLYVLGNYTLNLMKLRLENVQVGKVEFVRKMEFRLAQIEQLKEKTERKKEELENDRAKFNLAENEEAEKNENDEQVEETIKSEFNEEQWILDWDIKNPEIVIPDEPVKNIDNDIGGDYVYV